VPNIWSSIGNFIANKVQAVLIRIFIPIVLKVKGEKPGSWCERKLNVASMAIAKILRNYLLGKESSLQEVERSYDKASGSYIHIFDKKGYDKWSVIDNKVVKISTLESIMYHGRERREVLAEFDFDSVLEVGVGEFTTFNAVRKDWDQTKNIYAIDLSLNRLLHGRAEFLTENDNIKLAKANAHYLPLPSNSIDLVYTNHCLEWMPPGGPELALREAVRVAKKNIVLFEPAWRDADTIQRLKMRAGQYVTNIPAIAEGVEGCRLKEIRALANHINPFNRSSCYVFEITEGQAQEPEWVCPQCHGPLEDESNVLSCHTCQLVFFQYQGIPILDLNYAHMVTLKFSG
jgi:ubiquinone/menaquinone biosynthesis C-methylase UbiE